MTPFRLNNDSLKYQRLTLSGYKDKAIVKSNVGTSYRQEIKKRTFHRQSRISLDKIDLKIFNFYFDTVIQFDYQEMQQSKGINI